MERVEKEGTRPLAPSQTGYGMASAMTTPCRSTGPLGAVLREAVDVAGDVVMGDEAADRGRRHSGGAGEEAELEAGEVQAPEEIGDGIECRELDVEVAD